MKLISFCFYTFDLSSISLINSKLISLLSIEKYSNCQSQIDFKFFCEFAI